MGLHTFLSSRQTNHLWTYLLPSFNFSEIGADFRTKCASPVFCVAGIAVVCRTTSSFQMVQNQRWLQIGVRAFVLSVGSLWLCAKRHFWLVQCRCPTWTHAWSERVREIEH